MGLREEPTHPRHVQMFALISHLVYLLWTAAMVTNQTSVLTEDPMEIWTRYFDIKLSAAQGKVDIPMKESVVWLEYGCKGECKRSGMCPGLCLHCDTDTVADKIRGLKKADSTSSRYEAWKKGTLQGNASAKVSFADFKKNGPKSPKSVAKKGASVQICEEDYYYYDWLEENQHCFKLDIPDDLN